MNSEELTELRRKLPECRWIGDPEWPLIAYETRDCGAIMLIGCRDRSARFFTGQAVPSEHYLQEDEAHDSLENAMSRYMKLVSQAHA